MSLDAKKTKDESLEELVQLGFIKKEEKDVFKNLTLEGLELLIEKVSSMKKKTKIIPVEKKNSEGEKSTNEPQKSEGSNDELFQKRLAKQFGESSLGQIENFATGILSEIKKVRSSKK